jgi:hypothetical protein
MGVWYAVGIKIGRKADQIVKRLATLTPDRRPIARRSTERLPLSPIVFKPYEDC